MQTLTHLRDDLALRGAGTRPRVNGPADGTSTAPSLREPKKKPDSARPVLPAAQRPRLAASSARPDDLRDARRTAPVRHPNRSGILDRSKGIRP
jgi:hypothetical protein